MRRASKGPGLETSGCPVHHLARSLVELSGSKRPFHKGAEFLSESIASLARRVRDDILNKLVEPNERENLRLRYEVEFVERLMSDPELFEIDSDQAAHAVRSRTPLDKLIHLLNTHLDERAHMHIGEIKDSPDGYLVASTVEYMHRRYPRSYELDFSHYMLREVHASVHLIANFFEVVRLVYRKQFGQDIDAASYQAIVQAPFFINAMASIGHLGVRVEQPFLRSVGDDFGYNPDSFHLVQVGEHLALALTEEANQVMREVFNTSYRDRKAGKCPAGFVRVQDPRDQERTVNALRLFTERVVQFFVDHYLPLVTNPRKRKRKKTATTADPEGNIQVWTTASDQY